MNLTGGRGGEDPVVEEVEMREEVLDRMIEKEQERMTGAEVDEKLSGDCPDCGDKVEELELCLLGLDVTALFPSMTSARPAAIVRRRMSKSKIQLEGFDWKTGLVYIRMNKHLTPNLGSLWKILPYRRKVGGSAPGMASKG